jgi:hypothetical protein
VKQPVAIVLDLVDEAGGCRFRGFDGDVEPDFGKVGFRCVG